LNHVLDSTILAVFRTRILFLNVCGGHLQKGVEDFKRTRHDALLTVRLQWYRWICSLPYSSAFAFGAPIVDPLVTAMHFISVVVEFHVFANETVNKATKRGTRSILFHTSVYLANQEIYHLQDAALRLRPNGKDIVCHGQPARFIKKAMIATEEVAVLAVGFGPEIMFTIAAPGTALAEYISLQDDSPHLSL
jgi:hypothetical protein